MRRALTIPFALAVAATATFVVDTAASAAPTGAAPAQPVVIGHGITVAAKAAAAPPAATASSLAGYLAPLRPTNLRVTAMLRVPAVTCGTGRSADYLVVGQGSTTTGSFLGGLVQIGCNQGQATYQAAAYTGAATVSPKLVVNPRDTVMIVVTSGANPVVTITDRTTKTSVTGSVAAFTGNTAQFTVQAAGTAYPAFGKVPFSAVRVSGRMLTLQTATRYDQYDAGQPVLTTSPLTQATFRVTPAAT